MAEGFISHWKGLETLRARKQIFVSMPVAFLYYF